MEPVIVTIVVVVISWFAGALVYIYDQGRRQGTLVQKLQGVSDQADADRVAFRESMREIRTELKTSLARLDAMFLDHHGNPRLMSVDAHRSWCAQSHEVCAERFGRIVEGIAKGETDRMQRDNEIFNRLRKIERTVDRMASKMDVKEGIDDH